MIIERARWDSPTHGFQMTELDSIELSVSDAALHLSWRGEGNVVAVMSHIAAAVAQPLDGYVKHYANNSSGPT